MVWDRRMYGMKCLFFGGMLYIYSTRACVFMNALLAMKEPIEAQERTNGSL